jgi:hypothetical protein
VASEPEVIVFVPDHPDEVIARMRRLAVDRDGWVNLHPLIETEEQVPPDTSPLLSWLAAKGPAIPEATWVPGEVKRKRIEPDSIGIQHAAGTKARITLAERGAAVPDEWRLRADHPRRGLVVELPEGVDARRVVDWLVSAARALSDVQLPERWVAAIYRR